MAHRIPAWLQQNLDRGVIEDKADEEVRKFVKNLDEPFVATRKQADVMMKARIFVAIQVLGDVGCRDEGCIGWLHEHPVFLREEDQAGWPHYIIRDGVLMKEK